MLIIYLVVDIDSIRDRCPPVLLRFMGAVDGFRAPTTNDKGQLLFAQEYGITRPEMIACMLFSQRRVHHRREHVDGSLYGVWRL